jgi:hypothetical protein
VEKIFIVWIDDVTCHNKSLFVGFKDEVNDLAEVAESGRQITDAFTKAVKNAEEFGKRTLPIIKLAIDKGFI